MIFTFNGEDYKPKNTEKVQLAKDEVISAAKNLLGKYKEDDEMYIFILMELKNFADCGLEVLDEKIGFEGVKKFGNLEKIV